jgi:hypothetical protein
MASGIYDVSSYSIETYRPFCKFGYFDYDWTGKVQYRVRYKPGEGK